MVEISFFFIPRIGWLLFPEVERQLGSVAQEVEALAVVGGDTVAGDGCAMLGGGVPFVALPVVGGVLGG